MNIATSERFMEKYLKACELTLIANMCTSNTASIEIKQNSNMQLSYTFSVSIRSDLSGLCILGRNFHFSNEKSTIDKYLNEGEAMIDDYISKLRILLH